MKLGPQVLMLPSKMGLLRGLIELLLMGSEHYSLERAWKSNGGPMLSVISSELGMQSLLEDTGDLLLNSLLVEKRTSPGLKLLGAVFG